MMTNSLHFTPAANTNSHTALTLPPPLASWGALRSATQAFHWDHNASTVSIPPTPRRGKGCKCGPLPCRARSAYTRDLTA